MEELITKAYKKANFYYYALFAKAVLMAFLGYLINKQYPALFDFSEEFKTIVSSISMLFLVTSIPFAFWFFNKKVSLLAEIKELDFRFSTYMNLVKLRIILIGTNFVLNVILLYVFHNQSFLYAAGIGATAMIFCKPNKNNIDKELNPIVEMEDN